MTCFIGVFFFAELPMSSAQLLWINLIMDIIGAIALGTEPPVPSLVSGQPRSQTALLKAKFVWRQIGGVAVYMTVMSLLMFLFGRAFVGTESDNFGFDGYASMKTTKPDSCATYPEPLTGEEAVVTACQKYRQGAMKLHLLTLIFNSFSFMQIFNMINCRKVGISDKNILERPAHNIYFLVCLFGTCAGQVFLVNYAGWIMNTTPLTKE
jgi:Ca2+-transporting ATPase